MVFLFGKVITNKNIIGKKINDVESLTNQPWIFCKDGPRWIRSSTWRRTSSCAQNPWWLSTINNTVIFLIMPKKPHQQLYFQLVSAVSPRKSKHLFNIFIYWLLSVSTNSQNKLQQGYYDNNLKLYSIYSDKEQFVNM